MYLITYRLPNGKISSREIGDYENFMTQLRKNKCKVISVERVG